jgi:hypothetical protein
MITHETMPATNITINGNISAVSAGCWSTIISTAYTLSSAELHIESQILECLVS